MANVPMIFVDGIASIPYTIGMFTGAIAETRHNLGMISLAKHK